MKTEIVIRKSKPEDMPAVWSLINELALFEREPDAVEITVEDLVRDGFGATPKFVCFVAVQQNAIVGMALGYPRYSTWKGPTLHLEDLIITQKNRKQGIGLELFKNFMAYAASSGVKRVEWAVLDWNKSAIDFYKKQGAQVFKDWRVAQMNEKEIKRFKNI